ncbi:MAG: HAD family hydrolase [Actinobacteria bacterium]|nr:HAD family hydrolase [Actinomycetota bacterium]
MGVDAVIFDWGGTLTPWHTVDIRACWRAVARVLDPDRAEDVAERLLAAEAALWARVRTDHASATVDEVFTLAELTVGPDVLTERALPELFAFWEPYTHSDPAVLPLFRALRSRGIRIGVLSNTLWPRTEHERVLQRDGLLELIDGAVYSSEIPWAKPHPEAFRAALAAVDVVEPGRVVFVGDRLFEDVHGARSVGMRAVHVPHSAIPASERGHTQGVPDAVVPRLSELLGLVDSWRVAP